MVTKINAQLEMIALRGGNSQGQNEATDGSEEERAPLICFFVTAQVLISRL